MIKIDFLKKAAEAKDPKEKAPEVSVNKAIIEGEKGKLQFPKGEAEMPKVGPAPETPSPAMEGPKGDAKVTAATDTIKITKELNLSAPVLQGDKGDAKSESKMVDMPKMKNVEHLGDGKAPILEGDKGKLLPNSGEAVMPSIADNMPKTEKVSDYAEMGDKGDTGKPGKVQMPTEVPTEMVKGGDEFITQGEKETIKATFKIAWVKQSHVEKCKIIKTAFQEMTTLIKVIADQAGLEIKKSSLKKLAEGIELADKAFDASGIDALATEDEENPEEKVQIAPEQAALTEKKMPLGKDIVSAESIAMACKDMGLSIEDCKRVIELAKSDPSILEKANVKIKSSVDESWKEAHKDIF